MAGQPCYCDHCKRTFISDLFKISNSTNVCISGSVPCIYCNAQARTINEAFDYIGDNRIILSKASDSNIPLIKELQKKLRKDKSKTTIEYAAKKIKESFPELTIQADQAAESGNFYAIIMMILTIVLAIAENMNIDGNELLCQLQHPDAPISQCIPDRDPTKPTYG